MFEVLKLCVQKTFNIENKVLRITLLTLAIIFGTAIGYFIVISYACLCNQYVWSNMPHNPALPCDQADAATFYGFYIFYGLGYIILTGGSIVILVAISAGLYYAGYGIYLLFKICFGCCQDNYEAAKAEITQQKIDETTTLLKVNVDVT